MARNYLISIYTKAILNKDNPYYKSCIYEGDTIKNDIHRAEHILNHSCILNGSSLDGRRTFAKEILKCKNKLPIPVIPKRGVYMMPTCSPRSVDCAWISYYQVEGYEQRDQMTYILFRDGTSIYVHTTESAFRNQMHRTGELIAQINRPIYL